MTLCELNEVLGCGLSASSSLPTSDVAHPAYKILKGPQEQAWQSTAQRSHHLAHSDRMIAHATQCRLESDIQELLHKHS